MHATNIGRLTPAIMEALVDARDAIAYALDLDGYPDLARTMRRMPPVALTPVQLRGMTETDHLMDPALTNALQRMAAAGEDSDAGRLTDLADNVALAYSNACRYIACRVFLHWVDVENGSEMGTIDRLAMHLSRAQDGDIARVSAVYIARGGELRAASWSVSTGTEDRIGHDAYATVATVSVDITAGVTITAKYTV